LVIYCPISTSFFFLHLGVGITAKWNAVPPSVVCSVGLFSNHFVWLCHVPPFYETTFKLNRSLQQYFLFCEHHHKSWIMSRFRICFISPRFYSQRKRRLWQMPRRLLQRGFWTCRMKRKIDRIITTKSMVLIPLDALSKTWVCCLLRSEIVGSNPAETLISVPYDFCLFAGRGRWLGLITRPDESYRVWCVWVLSWNFWVIKRPCGPLGAVAPWGEGDKINWSYVIKQQAMITCGGRMRISSSLA